MKITKFKPGDKVVSEGASYYSSDYARGTYDTILAIGKEMVFFRRPNGIEYIWRIDNSDFYLHNSSKEPWRTIILGNDLVAAIRETNWDLPLRKPTPHMMNAINAWEGKYNA